MLILQPPHYRHSLLRRNRKTYGTLLTGDAFFPCWCTLRKLIQQSKTVEPNSTCQHRFISTGQTRPLLFPGRIYISNANFYPSAIPTFQPLDVPFFFFFLLCHLPAQCADVTGATESGRQAEGEKKGGALLLLAHCCTPEGR